VPDSAIGALTPHPEVNAVLRELLPALREVLADRLVGVYLTGSLAGGDFDRDSDVDVVVVTEEEVRGEQFAELDMMHRRIATIDSWCATQLEGTYISRRALRRFDPALAVHANIDRGRGERLKLAEYDEGWIVQAYLLRERAITLDGPDPQSLIDPVASDDLRRAMRRVLRGWASELLSEPARIARRGDQSYTVLSLCRILYTLEYGGVTSKRAAAEWAREALGAEWLPLLESAWIGRQHPDQPATVVEVDGTLRLIRLGLARAGSTRE
jgi:predicted nucleotidyltransferase